MKQWTPQQVAAAAGARLSAAPVDARADAPADARADAPGPRRAVVDSRGDVAGALFVGLPGASVDGGRFAPGALERGAWGVLVAPEHAPAAEAAARSVAGAGRGAGGVVLCAEDPLRALQTLARAWRRELGARVIGVTGSTGKTSTKDLLLALLAPHRATVASRANFNTEIGLPLEILAAGAGTEVLVLEMGMRGPGQIAELASIAEPDVAVIVSIGPVHLELLGSIEAIAAAKAELIAGLPAGGTAIIPAGERLLDPHRRGDVTTVTFGEAGDVVFTAQTDDSVVIDASGTRIELGVPFTQAHLRLDLLAAVAAARAVGVTPSGHVDLALTAGRGQKVTVSGGVTVIDGCYNANPMSMRAALADLADTAERTGAARRVAVLGDMLELGPGERAYHEALGALVTDAGVDLLVTVGARAAAIADRFGGETRVLPDAATAAAEVPGLLASGDLVLVKGSLGVGLSAVCESLGARQVAAG